MFGLGVKLPLTEDPSTGYTLVKQVNNLVKQNLKMILLTSPGERIMNPSFGVGLRRYLFEQKKETMAIEIRKRIFDQVRKYMKKIELKGVVIEGFEGELLGTNYIKVTLSYTIPLISPLEEMVIELDRENTDNAF